MTRSPALSDLLDKHGITPCGDASCMFGRTGGMHTNGGCRCRRNVDVNSNGWPDPLYRLVTGMAAIIRELDQQVAAVDQRRPGAIVRVGDGQPIRILWRQETENGPLCGFEHIRKDGERDMRWRGWSGRLTDDYVLVDDVRAGRWKERG